MCEKILIAILAWFASLIVGSAMMTVLPTETTFILVALLLNAALNVKRREWQS